MDSDVDSFVKASHVMTRPRLAVHYRFSRYCSLGRSNPFALSDWWMFLNQTEKMSFH